MGNTNCCFCTQWNISLLSFFCAGKLLSKPRSYRGTPTSASTSPAIRGAVVRACAAPLILSPSELQPITAALVEDLTPHPHPEHRTARTSRVLASTQQPCGPPPAPPEDLNLPLSVSPRPHTFRATPSTRAESAGLLGSWPHPTCIMS